MLNFKEKNAIIVRSSKQLVDWLLSINTKNRSVKKKHVTWLKQSVEKGTFILTGQGIGVSSDGILIDGQHRLMAIRDAGYPPVELLIVTGLNNDAQIYVDQHAKRSHADMLKIVLNQTISNRMTSAINFLLNIKCDDGVFVLDTKKTSLDEVVDMMAEKAELLSTIVNACGDKVRAATAAAVFQYAEKYDVDAAIAFALQLRDGENISRTDPAYRLREYIKQHRSGGGMQQKELFRVAVSACIAHAQGRQISYLKPSSSWENLPSCVKPSQKSS